MRKTVAYMITDDWREKVVPSITSLLLSTDVDRIYVLAESPAPIDLPKVQVLDVSGQEIFDRGGPNWSGRRFSHMVLMRAALHRLLPDEDLVLSIDADTIVLDDISGLWDTPMDDCYIAGAREPTKCRGGVYYFSDVYINAGVTLMNLRKLRDGTGDRVVEALNTQRFDFPEQDALNLVCQGGIRVIPSDYNVNHWTEPAARALILHFAAVRDWFHLPLVQEFLRRKL